MPHLRFSTKVPTSCPECKAPTSSTRYRDQANWRRITGLFPNEKIARFDRHRFESYRGRARCVGEKWRNRYNYRHASYCAKGLDLPHLTVVRVVQADTGLSLPFIANEHFSCSRVVGRVGRSSQRSRHVQSCQQITLSQTDSLKLYRILSKEPYLSGKPAFRPSPPIEISLRL